MTIKTFIILQKISISNKGCSFEIDFHQRIANQHIRIISKGLCEAGEKKFSFAIVAMHYILKYIQIKKQLF